MKRFQLIVLALIFSHNGFSQTDTTESYEDTTAYTGADYTDQAYEVVCFAPNAIIPDGSGRNVEWMPVIINNNPWKYRAIIYDRYGSVIWESYNQSVGWEGTLNGAPVMAGVYVWYITTLANATDKRFEFTGFVTVIR